MYTRYYDGYPRETPKIETANRHEESTTEIATDTASEGQSEIASVIPKGIFGNMKADDILLIALLFIVSMESSDDFIMPLILGALLLG